MMNEKSESDLTSDLGGSSTSSSASPKRDPTYNYYVQSPSRDSHEDVADNKSSTNSHTTPTHSSPTLSPSHPSQSRPSSASRVSGPYRAFAVGGKNYSHFYRKRKGWPPLFSVIDEEDEDYEEDYYRDQTLLRQCRIMMILMGLVMSFTAICLITWGVSRPYKPQVQMKSWKVNNFYYGEGTDYTGVPTKFLTVNCTVKMNIQNPATFFGIHVSSTCFNLSYSEIVVGSGQFMKYYQPKKSERTMLVNVEGGRVPLYGAGIGLVKNDRVPLKLEFKIYSHANLVGSLVKTKHHRKVFCIMEIDSDNNKFIDFQRESCSYT